jgi:diguanylate cyclase (GGDEF)-like protein
MSAHVDVASYAADPDAERVELRRALVAAEQRCSAALHQLDQMRHLNLLREQETALLRQAERKARRCAYYDELTGLPNRHLLQDRFKIAVALAARHDQYAALLFIDLDHFKKVNDTLGHLAGDRLLQQVAARLAGGIRASDTACRLGGDEFVVLLAGLSGRDAAEAVAKNLRMILAAAYVVEGTEVAITVSLGVAVCPGDADGYSDLLRVADRAMYRSKARRPVALSLVNVLPRVSGVPSTALLSLPGAA